MANQHTVGKWPERFWGKTEISDSGCINWIGSLDKDGYGRINAKESGMAHRISFLLEHGRMPAKDLDHICRNRRCVNPKHLREVSRVEQMKNSAMAMAPTCKNGHAWTEDNTYRSGGRRACRECSRIKTRRRYAINKLKKEAGE